MSETKDLLDKLERLLTIYQNTKEMELKRAEIAAKVASDVLERNRKSQLELMKFFNQFVNCTTEIKTDDSQNPP